VVLAIGAQDKVMEEVDCTVAVIRTAARSDEDWAWSRVAQKAVTASTRIRRERMKPFSMLVFRE
jgi:hypothetical protein